MRGPKDSEIFVIPHPSGDQAPSGWGTRTVRALPKLEGEVFDPFDYVDDVFHGGGGDDAVA